MQIYQSRCHLMNKLIYEWQGEILITMTIFTDVLTIDKLHQSIKQITVCLAIIYKLNYIRMIYIFQSIELIYSRFRAYALFKNLSSKNPIWHKGMQCLEYFRISTFTKFLIKRYLWRNLVSCF